MLSELQQCLTLLKQALHCPICFCITKHISSKRTVKCPLCNKQVTRRALKAADKFKEIAAVSEEIFTNFANESSMAFVPVVKIGSLHLSQEMSQAPLEVVEKKTEKLFRQPHIRPRRNSTLLKRSVRGAPQNGNRLVVSLGTSARVHKHKLLMSSLSNSAKTDEFAEATQPMYGEVEPTEDAAASTQPMRTNEVDLFAFTQSPQKPAADDTLTEFPLPSPTKSAGEDSSGENVAQVARPRCGATMQRINSEVISHPFTTTFALRKHPSSLSRNFASRYSDGAEKLDPISKRGSKLSLSSLSSIKRKSFLRGWSSRKRKSMTDSSDSSIPPLRERISSPSSVAPEGAVKTTPRRRHRKTNELYSPWLKNRLNFLKKYKLSSSGRMSTSDAKASLSSRASFSKQFSPGWSRIRHLNSDLGKRSKAQLLIRSTKEKFTRASMVRRFRSSSRSSLPKPLSNEPRRSSAKVVDSGPVCRFSLPLNRLGVVGMLSPHPDTFVYCKCGLEVVVEPGSVVKAAMKTVAERSTQTTLPSPAPIMHDKAVYWQGLNDVDSQATPFSQETSILTIQPSVIPQTWSVNTMSAYSLKSMEPVEPSETVNDKSPGQCESPQSALKATDVRTTPQVHAVAEPLSLSLDSRITTQTAITAPSPHDPSHSYLSEPSSLVPETPQLQPALQPPSRGSLADSSVRGTENELDAESCEFMPTIECDRLRQECADLEAEVAQLQQQLEAEALSPNETLKLLASAGTEPQDLDFIAPLPKHQPTEVESVREKADSIVPAPTSPDLSITRVSGPHDSDMDFRAPDASDLDAVDMIPSSQLEESMGELDTTEETKTAASVLQDRPVFLSNRSASACVTINKDDVGSALSRVTRVENSQTNNTTTSQNSSSSFLPLPVHTKPSPHLTQLQGPNVCVDTIPFTPPTGTQAAQMSSLIEDTENAAPGDTAKVQHPAIYITGSNLSSVELNSLRRFCRQFNAVEDSRFVPGRTTHVVVATETFRPRVAQRTFKYFMGILHRAWIVNTAWIRKCLLANALLNEESFEIQGDTVCGDCHEGPRRGRLKVPAFPSDPDPLRQVTDPSLVDRRPFSGLSLCPFGNLGALTKKDFAALVEGGGGTVISDPALFPAPTSVASDSKRRRALCNMILTSPSPQVDPNAYEELSRQYGVPVVNISWLLNCVSVYRRLPISKIYVIHPSPA
ncbi:hypothetical protein AAHC03_05517 [Spirometra sp. Aus1]